MWQSFEVIIWRGKSHRKGGIFIGGGGGGVDPSRHHVVPALFFIFIIFLTAIWQPHGQLWVILRGTASPTTDHCICLELFRSECHREPLNDVRSLILAERLVGFESGTSRFYPLSPNRKGY